MEKIKIEKFLGISLIDIEIRKINVLIGSQATGKSVTAKLLYYFKSYVSELIKHIEEENNYSFNKKLQQKFIEYFPLNTWGDLNFNIEYQNNDLIIKIKRIQPNRILIDDGNYSKKYIIEYKNKLKKAKENRKNLNLDELEYFEDYKTQIRHEFFEVFRKQNKSNLIHNQIYIPAGRSFFANLVSSIFSFLSSNNAIDPFLREFGIFYERMKTNVFNRNGKLSNIDKQLDAILKNILNGFYINEKGKDLIVLQDGRKVSITNCSSGQQESLPLILILKRLQNIRFFTEGATVYIEEPEAHLFPKSQKEIVNMLSIVASNSRSNLQFFILTHSPYILSSLNNNIFAGSIVKSKDEKRISKMEEKILRTAAIDPDIFTANMIKKGTSLSIFDRKRNLMNAQLIDEISNDIANEFDFLLEI